MSTPDSPSLFTKITNRDTLPSISSSETDALDWKAMIAEPHNRAELAKDMAAFANASGGSIVIGVRQGRATEMAEFKPLTQQAVRSLARAYEEAARDLISPPPTIETAAIEIENDGSGRWILAVNISPTEAIFCAVAIKPSQSGETTWLIPKRVASQTRYLSPADAQLMTVNKLRSATQRTLSLIEDWQNDLSQKEQIRSFEEFINSGSYYDICLPGLASNDSPRGLHYAVRPVRDSQGHPLRDVGEMRSRWIIEVIGPAHENILSVDQLKKYDATPICDGEYYYCEFYNGSWHMTDGGIGKAHPFYLSGKVGQAEWLQNANNFVEQYHKPSADHTHLFDLLLNLQGKQYPRNDGLNRYSIAVNKEGGLFLRINNSPPKRMYMLKPVDERDDSGWCFFIEKLRGHGGEEVLLNIRESIQSELQQRNIEIPRALGARRRGREYE